MSRIPFVLEALPRMATLPTAEELDDRINLIWRHLCDEELVAEGEEWYRGHAVEVMANLTADYGADRRTLAGMLAAMSAGYGWGYSTLHIRTLLEGRRDGMQVPYCWRFIEQAEAIRDGADPDVILRNSKGWTVDVKRWCFFHNLMGDGQPITVDVHMARGLTGGVLNGTPSTRGRYRLLADAVRRFADDYSFRPADAQAILWCAIRGESH